MGASYSTEYNESDDESSIKTIVVVSGYFDPIGVHHLILFEEAKKLGDYLIVGINSDVSGKVKKGQPCFMPFKERKYICEKLEMVDEVIRFEDIGDGSASLLLQKIYDRYEEEIDAEEIQIIFANGGDRSPDQEVCLEVKYAKENLEDKIKFIYGVGGFNKIGSSSEHLRNWVNRTMERYNIEFRLHKNY